MKALQTYYKDYFFRSRLEARFAVFFDALGEKWEYEVEGYDLDEGDYYLPDFWLPRLNCHVEIKGQLPTENEIRKCRKLQFFTERDVAIFHGLPTANEGMFFGWSEDRGGSFTESPAVWTLDDGLLTIADYPSGLIPEYAARKAKQARFEHEYAASRQLPSIVNYDEIAF